MRFGPLPAVSAPAVSAPAVSAPAVPRPQSPHEPSAVYHPPSMRLVSARVVGLGPFDDLSVPFHDDDGAPRSVTVVLGGGGVGKTTLLSAIASTRPGYAVAQTRPRSPARAAAPEPAFVVTDWALGVDDPARPHVLRVTSPNAVLAEPEEVSLLRRREQALFDKRATEAGFLLGAVSGARWFSRSAAVLSTPDRTITRWDVRAPFSFDDATRADLTRETKQALAFASIASALARTGSGDDRRQGRFVVFDEAMREVVSKLTALLGFRYVGADPATLEPIFATPGGSALFFDDLPTGARHLAALAALTVRALFAAYPAIDPRACEGVFLVDDAGLHLEPGVQRRLVPVLRDALPRVQWVLTTSSTAIALGCEPGEVVALRRMQSGARVELYDGAMALVH